MHTKSSTSPSPRGLLCGFNLDQLKARTREASHQPLWHRLVDRTRLIMAQARQSRFTLDGQGGLGWHSMTPHVIHAALMAKLTDDQDAMAYVRECVIALDQRGRDAKGREMPLHSLGQIAIACDIVRDELDDATRRTLLAFMREVAIDYQVGPEPYIMFAGGNNIPWIHNVATAICALLWGQTCEHPRRDEVIQHGVNHTQCYLYSALDDQGYGYEGTGYSHGVFHNLVLFAWLLRVNGVIDLFETQPRIRAKCEAIIHSIFPDFSYPTNDNDVGLQGAETLSELLFAWQVWHDPKLLGAWYAYSGPDHPVRPFGDIRHRKNGLDMQHAMALTFLFWDAGAEHTPVAESSRPLCNIGRGTGRMDVRTSWRASATYLNVLASGRSTTCSTHRHADAGHFSIFAHGEYLAIDTGRYNIDEDQHSVVMVEGRPYEPSGGWHAAPLGGRIADWRHHPLLTYALVDASLQKGCHWARRQVCFVPCGEDDAYILILDNINKDNAAHRYLWQMQAHPDTTIEINRHDQARVLGQNARLDVSFFVPQDGDFPDLPFELSLRQDVKKWAWPYQHEPEAYHFESGLLNSSPVRPRLLAEYAGPTGLMLTVIQPRKIDAPPLKITRHPVRRMFHLDIEWPGYVDTWMIAPDHGFIDLPGCRAQSEMVLQRRTNQEKLLDQWQL